MPNLFKPNEPGRWVYGNRVLWLLIVFSGIALWGIIEDFIRHISGEQGANGPPWTPAHMKMYVGLALILFFLGPAFIFNLRRTTKKGWSWSAVIEAVPLEDRG